MSDGRLSGEVHVCIFMAFYNPDTGVLARTPDERHAEPGTLADAAVVLPAARRDERQLERMIARAVTDALYRARTSTSGWADEDDCSREPLSARENGILQMIAQGMNNREIAAALSLTEGTVRNYNSKILAKLHACDRTQAVIKAARRGIVKL
jgi:DNA-binding NarL/FixJ family response regulator